MFVAHKHRLNVRVQVKPIYPSVGFYIAMRERERERMRGRKRDMTKRYVLETHQSRVNLLLCASNYRTRDISHISDGYVRISSCTSC